MQPFALLEQQLRGDTQPSAPVAASETTSAAEGTTNAATPTSLSAATSVATPREATLPPKRITSFACGHVIAPDRVLVAALSRGPLHAATHTPLSFSFAKRGDPVLLRELGATLANLTRVVPHGVVVFFPSYAFEQQAVKYLKTHTATGAAVAQINNTVSSSMVPAGAGAGATDGVSMWDPVERKKKVGLPFHNTL